MRGERVPRWATAVALLVAFACAAREVPIVLLHTTDLHGRLVNLVPEGGVASEAGLWRCATLIRRVRAREPNVLWVDCGDTIQGTLESLETGGRLMLDALARAGCDAWVLGNHEFDWGLPALRALVEASPIAVLGANIGPAPGAPPPLPGIRSWIVRELGGVRVGVVGTTHPTTPRWQPPGWLEGLAIRAPQDAIGDALPALRSAGAEVLVLVVHEGLRPGREDPAPGAVALAGRYPDFDVVLGAHTHEAIAEQMLAGGVLYAQAGCHGQWVGRVDIVYDTLQRRVVRKSGVLLPVDATVEPDADLVALTGSVVQRASNRLERVVAQVVAPWSAEATAPGDENIARLLRKVIMETVGADVVIHGRLSEAELTEGDVRVRDVWRVVPYENRIGICRWTVTEIRAALEEMLSTTGRTVSGISGLRVRLDPAAEAGRRVVRIELPDGSLPHPRRRFRVAMNSHAIASAGGRWPGVRRMASAPEAALEITAVDTRSALLKWLAAKRRITLADLPPPGFAPSARSPD
ncbi:MAG: 5'-nucleotidase C-terminal domain-containing protein [Kiritimatiellae bacterium]|nr:5'-nucleotidase C-terminal domain-containing protein [Kiritimatiellia bacterium]